MSLKIKVKKIIVQGVKKVEVISIEGLLKQKELPLEYLTGDYMRASTDNPEELYLSSAPNLQVGFRYSIAEWGRTVKYMQECGKKLSEINKRLRRENEEWFGEIIVII